MIGLSIIFFFLLYAYILAGYSICMFIMEFLYWKTDWVSDELRDQFYEKGNRLLFFEK